MTDTLAPEGAATAPGGTATTASAGPEAPLEPPPSYRALLTVPFIGRALLGMQIARIASSMVGVAIVLFALNVYRSSSLAGLITFVSIAPGLLVSPVAGALLDRHGRTRLIVLDFVVATAAMSLIGGLSLAGLLPLWLLFLIAGASSLTGPLSATGLRTLFPLMVPRRLWERVNAVDSNGWVAATIVGPPFAAVVVGIAGGAVALVVIGAMYGIAAVVISGVPEPEGMPATDSTGRLLLDAWRGLVYTWRNPTLRGLGFSISILNVGWGMQAIIVPLIVLDRLGMSEATVGFVFAVQGLAGVVTGFVAGRVDTRGRELAMIAVPMLLMAPAVALLLPVSSLALVVVVMAVTGALNGPMDVAMFTLRQRRTDPAWMGRAFAVSMSFNFSGFPIGAAIGGAIAAVSLDAAILVGVVSAVVSAVVAFAMVPRDAPEEWAEVA